MDYYTTVETVLDDDPSHLLDMLQSEYVGMYGEPDPNPDGGLDWASEPHGGLLVLHAGGAVAVGGWAELREFENTAVLRRMYVRYDQRRKGYAKALLLAIEEHARKCGMDQMWLETGTVQTAAINLYTSMGYRPVAPFGYYAGQTTSVFLGKDL